MPVTRPWKEPNPFGQTPTRFRERPRVHVTVPGQSPGTMESDDSATEQQPATIRRLWRQVLSGQPGPPPFPVAQAPAVFTRALRYRAATTYKPAGTLNTRLSMLHTVVRMVARQPRPILEAGTRRARPTVRNRMSSFGSRVPPLNPRVRAAQQDEATV